MLHFLLLMEMRMRNHNQSLLLFSLTSFSSGDDGSGGFLLLVLSKLFQVLWRHLGRLGLSLLRLRLAGSLVDLTDSTNLAR